MKKRGRWFHLQLSKKVASQKCIQSKLEVVKKCKITMGIHEISTANAVSANIICDHHIFRLFCYWNRLKLVRG